MFPQNVFWTRRIQFWLAFSEISTRIQKWFCSKSEDILTKNFKKNAFPQSVRRNIEKAVLRTLRKNLCRMSEKNLLKVWLCTKNKTIKKIRIFKKFSEHVQNSLDSLSVKKLPKVRKKIAHGPQKRGRVFQRNFLIRVFPWIRGNQFWQFCNKKIVISQKELFRPKFKRLKKKNCFPSKSLSEGVGSSFENFRETFVPKVR